MVIRRPQPEEPTEQLTLFQLGHYHYQVLVTNLALQPLNLWRFYNDRAGIKLVIRQLKGDYALGRISGHHFFANETYFHLFLLAYNLINWFKRLCLPPNFQNAIPANSPPANPSQPPPSSVAPTAGPACCSRHWVSTRRPGVIPSTGATT